MTAQSKYTDGQNGCPPCYTYKSCNQMMVYPKIQRIEAWKIFFKFRKINLMVGEKKGVNRVAGNMAIFFFGLITAVPCNRFKLCELFILGY